MASTILKVDYIRNNNNSEKKIDVSEKKPAKNHKISTFAKCVVWINGFIAASAIFVPTFNTFQSYGMIICWTMAFYAISSSIYSSINYATPLVSRMAEWISKLFSKKKEERESARFKLSFTFFNTTKQKIEFFITTIGTLTSSLFLFYSIHNTFYIAFTFPFKCFTHQAIPHYFWTISYGLAIFFIIWTFIPGYALSLRESAYKAEEAWMIKKNEQASKIKNQTSEQVPKKSKPPTLSWQELKKRRKGYKNKVNNNSTNDNITYNISSTILFYLFASLGVICWFVCSLVLSVGTYIGAQHIFGGLTFCTMVSDVIFIIDFLYQLNYYNTELCRKIINTLMNMPGCHCFFETQKKTPETKAHKATHQEHQSNNTATTTPTH